MNTARSGGGGRGWKTKADLSANLAQAGAWSVRGRSVRRVRWALAKRATGRGEISDCVKGEHRLDR